MTRTISVSRGALASAVVFALAAAFAGGARAAVIYDATGGAEMGGDVADPNTLPGNVGIGPLLADRFLSPVAEQLTSVTLNLKRNGAPLNGFTVDLWRDSTTTPGLPVGPEIQIALVRDASLTSNFALYTFTPLSNIKLDPNAFYDIGIDTGPFANQVTNVVFGNTVDPAVLARPSVVTGALYFHTVGGIDPNIDGPYEAIVNANAVPEASTWAMMVLGLAGLGFAGYRSRRMRSAPAIAA